MTLHAHTRADGPAPPPPAPERPDPQDWPGLATAPTGARARVAARVARGLFVGAVRRLPLTAELAATSGRPAQVLGRGGPVLRVHRPTEFFARLGRDGLIGFGEAYLTGAWDADDLGAVITVLAARVADLVPRPLQRLRGAYVSRPPRREKNTRTQARGNIAHHYDLSNDLFGTFLDPTMNYSSALFDTDVVTDTGTDPSEGVPGRRVVPPDPGSDLEQGQTHKVERLLDATGVGAGTRVLEIGTGWGELAIRAARRGATIHSVTLSAEQQQLARERIADAGLGDRATVALCDYREVTGTYDVVLSVEMIEAVGHEYWQTYFTSLDRVLAPGGRVGLQAITMPHDRMLATRDTRTWITKYIFPGGFLPSLEVIDRITREHTALRLTDRLSFASHYAETLRQWDVTFRTHREQVRALGFDDTFCRMWHFYLEYSRGGFAAEYLDVSQLVLTREEPA